MALRNRYDIEVGVKGAKKSTKAINKVGGSMKGLSGRLMGGAGLVAGFVALGRVMSASVEAFKRQELSVRRLDAVLKSTANSSGLVTSELLSMSKAMQQTTKFGDEVVNEASAMMLTFTKIGKEVFPQAIKATLNMASAMGQDLKQTVIQVGKALNDPILGVTALRRVGVQLAPVQEQQIRDFMAVNDTASAQAIILGELRTQFGGMAEAEGLSFTGQMAQVDNRISDVSENFGEALAPALLTVKENWASMLETISDWLGITPDLQDAIDEATLGLDTERILLSENISALKDENVPRERKARIMKDLNLQYKDYTEIQLKDANNAKEIAEFYNQINNALSKDADNLTHLATVEYHSQKATQESTDVIRAKRDVLERLFKWQKTSEEFNANLRTKLSAMSIADMVAEIEMIEKRGVGQSKSTTQLSAYGMQSGLTAVSVKQLLKILEDENKEYTDQIKNLNDAKEAQESYAKAFGQDETTPGAKAKAERLKKEAYFTEELEGNLEGLSGQEMYLLQLYREEQELLLANTDAKWRAHEADLANLELAETAGLLTPLQVEHMELLRQKTEELRIEKDKENEARIQELVLNKESEKFQKWNLKYYGEAIKGVSNLMSINAKNAKHMKNYHNAGLAIDAGKVVADWASGMVTAVKEGIKLGWPQGAIIAAQNMAVLTSQKTASLAEIGAQKLQYGTDEVVESPTLFMAGEAGAERLQVTPLNPANDINDLSSGGTSVVVNLSGNVMSKDFVEEELIEQLNEAVRRGALLGS